MMTTSFLLSSRAQEHKTQEDDNKLELNKKKKKMTRNQTRCHLLELPKTKN